MNNLIVASHVNQLMTGNHQHWLGWLMSHYFAEVGSFDRALSVCCGDGAHELALLQSGKVRHLSGFDISAGAVRQAEDRIRAAGFSDDRFDLKVADANRLVLEGHEDFDSIVRLLLAFEDVLVEHGVIQSDFVFVVCRPKSGTAAGRSWGKAPRA